MTAQQQKIIQEKSQKLPANERVLTGPPQYINPKRKLAGKKKTKKSITQKLFG
ncbi:MAG TPA: hypothetical protein PKX72_11905 [Chitinophagales bacterium]|nr:hypothetical protein [Chitinophagales bacterium]